MAWQKVASLDALRDGGVLGVEVEGTTVALLSHRRRGPCDRRDLHARARACSPTASSTATTIECPLHQAVFDIRTGEVLSGPATEEPPGLQGQGRGQRRPDRSRRRASRRREAVPAASDAAAAGGPHSPAAAHNGAGNGARRESATCATAASCCPSNTSGRATISPSSPTGSTPTRTSTSARSSGSSMAAPGTTWRWKPRWRIPATSSAPTSGPTPVVVARAQDGSINVFENRCMHRAAEFCRELSGNANEFVCPYHQWTYDLKGNLIGVPFRRGVDGKGGMPADFQQRGARAADAEGDDPPRRRVRLLCGRHRAARRLSRAGDPARVRGDVRRPQAQGARPLSPLAAGQLEALSREPQGPLSRDAAAHVPGDVRAHGGGRSLGRCSPTRAGGTA